MKSVIFVLLLLAGCDICPTVPTLPAETAVSTVSPVSGDQLSKVKERIDADPRIFEQCVPLTDVAAGASLYDLMEVHKKDSLSAGECARRTSTLIRLLKDVFRLE